MFNFDGVKIVSAFPGTGKSFLANEYKELIADSDSSDFSWVTDPDTGEKVRNPNFVDDYFKEIMRRASSGLYKYVFISSHQEIRDELNRRGVPFHTIVPDYDDRPTYIQRYKDRGSPEPFIKLIDTQWYTFISSVRVSESPKGFTFTLGENEYVKDILTRVYGAVPKSSLQKLV